MAAHKIKLTIDQGATFRKSVVWRSGATVAAAPPVARTGCTARAQIRAELDSPDVLLEMSTENGRVVLGGETGEIRLEIDAVTTAAIDWESGVYDLEVVFPDNTVVRRMAGTVTVTREVTRD